MFNIFARKSKEDMFWKWIDKNIYKLKKIKDGYDPIYQQANKELKKYSKELIFEICGDEIVITADGDKKHFNDVIRLCKKAPKRDTYKVTAFRQPQGFYSITYNGVKVDHEDIYFQHKYRDDLVDIDIYHKDFTEETQNNIGSAIFLILDHGIGEYNVETKLGYIEFHQFTGQKDLLKIKELNNIIEKHSKSVEDSSI